MSARVIYRPIPPHRCDLPKFDWPGKQLGYVAKCDACGLVWVSYGYEWRILWRPLRPWPFDRKVRRILRERGEF